MLRMTDKAKILLEISKDLLNKIEDFRFSNRIPSRSEAVRRLIKRGLEVEKTDQAQNPEK